MSGTRATKPIAGGFTLWSDIHDICANIERLAAFYVVGIASTGLSGLLAFALEKMDGTAGLAGWRWIFIIVCLADSSNDTNQD